MLTNKLLGSIAVVICATNSHADFIGVDIIAGANQHPDGQHDTWQVIAVFDNPNDKMFAVISQPVCFYTGSGVLYNQALYAGSILNDFPTADGLGGESYDSFVTTGATTFPSNTYYTDDWQAHIVGSEFCSNGGWTFIGVPQPVSVFDIIKDNNTFDVVVAQFTVDEGAGIHLEGEIVWQMAGGGKSISALFEVDNITATCPWDLDESGDVATADLLVLLSAWGTKPDGPPDFDEDGVVGTSDLLLLLANWGPCS